MKLFSSLVLLLFLAPAAWAAPADPTVTPLASPACPDPSTMIRVMWTYLDSDGNRPAATTFDIDRCTGTGCTGWSNIATGVTTQGYLHTGLSANTIYRFRYRVVDGSGTSGYSPLTADITTAATDDNLVRYPTTVSTDTAGMSVLFGPMTCATTTATTYDPFTWLSSNQDTQAAYWKGRMPKHGPGVLTGTITTTSGSPTLTGTGTAFLQELNTDDSVNGPSNFHAVYGNGTLLGTVASCASNTSCTLDANAAAVVTGVAGATWNPNTDQDTVYLNNIYYDIGWNLYINAFRQGTVADFEDARWVADSWFSGRVRQGRMTVQFGTPRGASLGMLFARALDGRPEVWHSLVIWTFEKRAEWITNQLIADFLYSPRDQGYMGKYINAMNRLLPDTFPTSDLTCTTVNNCGGTYTDGATLRDALKTSIAAFMAVTEVWQEDNGVWLNFGTGGAGNAEDTAGAQGFGQTLLLPLFLDALGDIANNPNLTSTTRNSARKQLLKGANYLGMIAYNTQRVNNDPTVNQRANWYAHGGGTVPNPTENRLGNGNLPLTLSGYDTGVTRQNGCTVPNTFAHAFALSGKAVYQNMGMEYMNSLWAEIGENTGGTGDGEKNIANGTDGKQYSECYRSSMQMLARNLESPSSLGTAPVADAGSDVTLTGGQNVVTLSSTSGSCANTPCTVFWAIRNGPQNYGGWNVVLPTIYNDTTNTPTIINADPGVYTLVKMQTDALGMGDDDTMTLTVGSGDLKPTAFCWNQSDGAYPIQKVSGTTSTTLTCYAAPSGASETYIWSWGTPLGPKNLSAATVTSPTASSSVVTLPGDGDYLFITTVTGNTSGLSRVIYTPFTVHRSTGKVPVLASNTIPVVNAGIDQVLAAGITQTRLSYTVIDAKAWQTYDCTPVSSHCTDTLPTGYAVHPDDNAFMRGPGTFATSCNNSASVSNGTTISPTIDVQNGTTTCTVTYNDGLDNALGVVTITAQSGNAVPNWRGRINVKGRIVRP